MGLSRNKVAVSEGAAGSPPFYGDRDRRSAEAQRNDRSSKVENKTKKAQMTFTVKRRKTGFDAYCAVYGHLLFNCQGPIEKPYNMGV